MAAAYDGGIPQEKLFSAGIDSSVGGAGQNAGHAQERYAGDAAARGLSRR
ncbi:hypothetical protein GCM10023195_16940 [Actinoallomurus liliacearum]|uniref:Uncharacterized protein n=1 Tax=Actinoallomurus liliacearum TaxID=1080073 RepID=A0ABP8TD36_9ACTN